MNELFKETGLNPILIEALKKEKIDTPTEIQRKVIPIALENKDLIGQSETGTGKTLAYLLPIFQNINPDIREIYAIILAPTHELVIQIQRQIEILSKNSKIDIISAPIIGNVNIKRQIEKLKEKPQIIVGTPGRILELMKLRKIKVHTTKTIIIDEADRLLDDHNLENVKLVIKGTMRERQLMLFSATISPATIEIAKEMMKEPQFIKAEEEYKVASTLSHIYFVAEQRDKIEVLRKLVRSINPPKAIVFVNRNDEIEATTEKLKFHKLKVEGIHGTSIKADRKKAMDDLKSGKTQLLVASDIAARGLDIKGVTHIFNLDVPEDPKNYLHRVGRTGRAGEKGTAISIIIPKELSLIKRYEKTLKIEILPKDMYLGKIIDVQKSQGRNDNNMRDSVKKTKSENKTRPEAIERRKKYRD